ncbi:class I SAM-dependent methyltransferase [Actinomycetospora cinnamomea]|uniref:Methyltransferase family protein n=1 Tax=Actinomycetospora cinnamomea TaxID=663609 RepID=A0A2U1FRL2_9PSEU|nr:methyltransferase domain-containing protein [Actinomycetospora cinnamomea]PVZ14818.1 methyltransferase family protein [Actinomycetospora cinnamomea]
MTATQQIPAAPDADEVGAFAQRVLADQGTIFLGVLTYLGDRLGLYRAMAGAGPLDADELATRTGCAERYLREWLAAQAAGGYLTHDAGTGRFALPDEHAAVLAVEDTPASVVGGILVGAAAWADADRLAEAFRSGAGIGWQDHDPRLFEGTERFYAAGYRASLLPTWLPALDDVVGRLERGARVLDAGTGHGAPVLMMAGAFPASTFVGVDAHAGSVATATERAAALGLADQVRFEVASVTGYDRPVGGYDLVCMFDVLHDLGDPVAAAAHARASLAPDGVLMLVEPRAGDRVEDNLHPLGQLFYAASTAFCTSVALSQPGPAGGAGVALGAQAGTRRLHDVLLDAGFTRVRQAAATEVNVVIEARP